MGERRAGGAGECSAMFPIRDHNPSGRMPFVTLALLAANIVIFLATYVATDDLALMRVYAEWGSIPARITAGEGYATLISHMFLHGGWMHLIGNMLFLWIFGDNMEEEFGHLGFFLFYIACGLVALLNPAAHITQTPACKGR